MGGWAAMRNILGPLLIGMTLTFSGGVVRAGPLEDGNAAYQRGDYATTLRLFQPLAEQGNAFAQYNLGLMYALGQGVQRNDSEAVKWYRLAAGQGFAEAQTYLGFMMLPDEVFRRIIQKPASGFGSLRRSEIQRRSTISERCTQKGKAFR
jgi:TPR repeat protein